MIIILIIMSLTPVSSSNKDIRGVPSMQSSYSAEMKRNEINMEEKSVHCKCVGEIRGDNVQAIDIYGGRDFRYKEILEQTPKNR